MQERRAHPTPDDPGLDGLLRHVALADGMVLAVVLVHQWIGSGSALRLPIVIASAIFACASLALRIPRVPIGARATRLELEAWAMAIYVSVVVVYTGGIDSPLQSLYLLPTVLAALALGQARFVLLIVAIALFEMILAAAGASAAGSIAMLVGRFVVATGPLLLVGWLTAALGQSTLVAQRRAVTLADGDLLTGLASRKVLTDELRRRLTHRGSGQLPLAVIVLDLEGLRRINETYGHETGNRALRLVAEALKRTLRETDVIARWGGDEFAALISGADPQGAEITAKRIRHAVHATTLDTGSRHLRCAVAVGIAVAPQDGLETTMLLGHAERRLERDRELRRPASTPLSASMPGDVSP